MCLCRDWISLWAASPRNTKSVSLNNKHSLPGNQILHQAKNTVVFQARNQMATYAFSPSVFLSAGHFYDPAEVVDEQLSMVTVLNIAMTTRFMGQEKTTEETGMQ